MATFKHPNLPGQLVSYPEDAAAVLAVSGWVDVNTPDPEPDTGYSDWTKDELAAELESRGLPKSGTKDELIARLDDDDVSATEPEEPAEA